MSGRTGQPTNLSALNLAEDTEEVGSPGGTIIRYNAAEALLLGDIVYLSGANEVSKSATPSDYVAFAGVVVGGASFSTMGYINQDSSLIGNAAAAEDEFVLVQTTGICYAVADDTITAGDILEAGAAVAGTVVPETTGLPLIGTALEDAVDEAPVKILMPVPPSAAASVSAGALTGTELAATVVDSSLTSVGELDSLVVAGTTDLQDDVTMGGDITVDVSAGSITALIATLGAQGLRVATDTPSAEDDTGTAGTISWDADYIYVCVATDTWKRVAIAGWP